MQPQPIPAPAVQQAPPQSAFPTQADIAQIQQATGFAPDKIMQDIQSTGARSADELMATYSQQSGGDPQQQGIDPSAVQGAMGMPPDDQSQAMPPQAPVASGPRGMAQSAMRGEPMPDEAEPPAEAGMESMTPGAEAAEGIQPNIAAAAHSSRHPVMHRAMKGKPVHHSGGKHRGRRLV